MNQSQRIADTLSEVQGDYSLVRKDSGYVVLRSGHPFPVATIYPWYGDIHGGERRWGLTFTRVNGDADDEVVSQHRGVFDTPIAALHDFVPFHQGRLETT